METIILAEIEKDFTHSFLDSMRAVILEGPLNGILELGSNGTNPEAIQFRLANMEKKEHCGFLEMLMWKLIF